MTVSCGILFMKEGCVFVGRCKGQDRWDIPKGKIELGETPIQAAIRETWEESGYVVAEGELIDLGCVPYRRGKQLNLFLYVGDHLPDPELCKERVARFDVQELVEFQYADFAKLSKLVSERMMRAIGRCAFTYYFSGKPIHA